MSSLDHFQYLHLTLFGLLLIMLKPQAIPTWRGAWRFELRWLEFPLILRHQVKFQNHSFHIPDLVTITTTEFADVGEVPSQFSLWFPQFWLVYWLQRQAGIKVMEPGVWLCSFFLPFLHTLVNWYPLRGTGEIKLHLGRVDFSRREEALLCWEAYSGFWRLNQQWVHLQRSDLRRWLRPLCPCIKRTGAGQDLYPLSHLFCCFWNLLFVFVSFWLQLKSHMVGGESSSTEFSINLFRGIWFCPHGAIMCWH